MKQETRKDPLSLIEVKSLEDVALFVSHKLSPLESALSTATHFVLRKYKDHGVIF